MAEHLCTRDCDIAEVLGASPPWVSEIFKAPETKTPRTIAKLVSKLHSPDLRQRIVSAWLEASFGGLGVADADPKRNASTRVETLRKNAMPDRGLAVALEVLEQEPNQGRHYELILRAYRLALSLDLPGEAAALAARLGGSVANDPVRRAAGLALLATAMRRGGLPDQEIQPVLLEASELLRICDEGVYSKRPDAVLARDRCASERAEFVMRTHRATGGLEGELSNLLLMAKERVEQGGTTEMKARALQFLASVHLTLGQTFAAHEAISRAQKLVEENNTSPELGTALLKARILYARGEKQKAIDYLQRVSRICARKSIVDVRRLAQAELVRIHSESFKAE